MASRSKAKGDKGEREVEDIFWDAGFSSARRALGAGRKDDVGDVHGLRELCLSVKRTNRSLGALVYEALPDLEKQRRNRRARFSALFTRADRKPWVVHLSVPQFIRLYKYALIGVRVKHTKFCPSCAQQLSVQKFYSNEHFPDRLSPLCVECTSERRSETYARRRIAFLDELGGKCVRCGYADWRALQVDHVNGGGTEEQRQGRISDTAYYARVRENPDDYQLLCANCNTIKKVENGEVSRKPPHGPRKVPTERRVTPKIMAAEDSRKARAAKKAVKKRP